MLPTGYLHPYIKSGAIRAGTLLTWERPRLGERHTAVVTDHGYVWVNGHPEPFESPSGAAKAVAGTHTNGWTHAWRLPDGRRLDAIRHP